MHSNNLLRSKRNKKLIKVSTTRSLLRFQAILAQVMTSTGLPMLLGALIEVCGDRIFFFSLVLTWTENITIMALDLNRVALDARFFLYQIRTERPRLSGGGCRCTRSFYMCLYPTTEFERMSGRHHRSQDFVTFPFIALECFTPRFLGQDLKGRTGCTHASSAGVVGWQACLGVTA